MIKLHKKYISWCEKKFSISNYEMLWISFFKGAVLGFLIYHFLID